MMKLYIIDTSAPPCGHKLLYQILNRLNRLSALILMYFRPRSIVLLAGWNIFIASYHFFSYEIVWNHCEGYWIATADFESNSFNFWFEPKVRFGFSGSSICYLNRTLCTSKWSWNRYKKLCYNINDRFQGCKCVKTCR